MRKFYQGLFGGSILTIGIALGSPIVILVGAVSVACVSYETFKQI